MDNTTTIYFLSDTKGNVKIGRTRNVRIRQKQLQTANINNLKLLYSIKNMPLCMEQHIHSICERYHVSGEWFKDSSIDHLLSHPWYHDRMIKHKK